MDGSMYLGARGIETRIATKVNVQRLDCKFLIAGRNNRGPSTEDIKSKRNKNTDTEGQTLGCEMFALGWPRVKASELSLR